MQERWRSDDYSPMQKFTAAAGTAVLLCVLAEIQTDEDAKRVTKRRGQEERQRAPAP